MEILKLCLIFVCSDFPICDHEDFQYNPSVIFVDSLYYVFWSDFRYSASIYAARVKPDGTVIDTSGQFLYHGYPISGARVAYDNQNFLAVFRDGC
ncbi:hypothetical protein KAS56_03570 [candidate division WOR-3 bacterium]|nr:hypothetical protein [candidate division WOR-3 bacterium]